MNEHTMLCIDTRVVRKENVQKFMNYIIKITQLGITGH